MSRKQLDIPFGAQERGLGRNEKFGLGAMARLLNRLN